MTQIKVKPRPVSSRAVSVDEHTSAVFRQILNEAARLEDLKMRDLWLDALGTFSKTGDLGKVIDICKWRRKVVDIDEFMFSDAFLALSESEIYPSVLQACHDLDTGMYNEAVLTGALGTGKSTIANIMVPRDIYKLSCMRHPQTTFGIQAKSSIVFTIQSVRLNTAKKAVFEEMGRYIRTSPYFRQYFPYDPLIQSHMIFREQNIVVMPVSSSSTGVISMNVIGGILDEMNFMQSIQQSKSSQADEKGVFDQAKQLYLALSRRRKSRFVRQGEVPGVLFLVSSSRFPDDFTEKKAEESTMRGGPDAGIYVLSKSQWEAKGRNHFLPESFRVAVGTVSTRSRVLDVNEPEPPGQSIVEVPMDFYAEFVKDTDGSLRDFAGITTRTTSPYISRPEIVTLSMERAASAGYGPILNVEEIDLSIGNPVPKKDFIRLDVKQPRSAHIDLGLRKDACGLAIGHIAGYRIVEKKPEDGGVKSSFEILPIIGYDLVLRIRAPHKGEIEFATVRSLLISLRDDYGIPLKWVTFDGFQSVDSRQILRRQGFETDYLSVEAAEPWRAFRDGLYEERILLPRHQYLTKELTELERKYHNNKEKIDHPPNGTKDVADAACGVYNFFLSRRNTWPPHTMFSGGAVGAFLYGDAPIRERIAKDLIVDTTFTEDLKPANTSRGILRKNAMRISRVTRR